METPLDPKDKATAFVIMAEIDTLRFLSMKNPDDQVRQAAMSRLEIAKANLESLESK